MHMFSQYDSDGPLFIILKVTFEYMQRNDMRGIDALTEAGREQVTGYPMTTHMMD